MAGGVLLGLGKSGSGEARSCPGEQSRGMAGSGLPSYGAVVRGKDW